MFSRYKTFLLSRVVFGSNHTFLVAEVQINTKNITANFDILYLIQRFELKNSIINKSMLFMYANLISYAP